MGQYSDYLVSPTPTRGQQAPPTAMPTPTPLSPEEQARRAQLEAAGMGDPQAAWDWGFNNPIQRGLNWLADGGLPDLEFADTPWSAPWRAAYRVADEAAERLGEVGKYVAMPFSAVVGGTSVVGDTLFNSFSSMDVPSSFGEMGSEINDVLTSASNYMHGGGAQPNIIERWAMISEPYRREMMVAGEEIVTGNWTKDNWKTFLGSAFMTSVSGLDMLVKDWQGWMVRDMIAQIETGDGNFLAPFMGIVGFNVAAAHAETHPEDHERIKFVYANGYDANGDGQIDYQPGERAVWEYIIGQYPWWYRGLAEVMNDPTTYLAFMGSMASLMKLGKGAKLSGGVRALQGPGGQPLRVGSRVITNEDMALMQARILNGFARGVDAVVDPIFSGLVPAGRKLVGGTINLGLRAAGREPLGVQVNQLVRGAAEYFTRSRFGTNAIGDAVFRRLEPNYEQTGRAIEQAGLNATQGEGVNIGEPQLKPWERPTTERGRYFVVTVPDSSGNAYIVDPMGVPIGVSDEGAGATARLKIKAQKLNEPLARSKRMSLTEWYAGADTRVAETKNTAFRLIFDPTFADSEFAQSVDAKIVQQIEDFRAINPGSNQQIDEFYLTLGVRREVDPTTGAASFEMIPGGLMDEFTTAWTRLDLTYFDTTLDGGLAAKILQQQALLSRMLGVMSAAEREMVGSGARYIPNDSAQFYRDRYSIDVGENEDGQIAIEDLLELWVGMSRPARGEDKIAMARQVREAKFFALTQDLANRLVWGSSSDAAKIYRVVNGRYMNQRATNRYGNNWVKESLDMLTQARRFRQDVVDLPKAEARGGARITGDRVEIGNGVASPIIDSKGKRLHGTKRGLEIWRVVTEESGGPQTNAPEWVLVDVNADVVLSDPIPLQDALQARELELQRPPKEQTKPTGYGYGEDGRRLATDDFGNVTERRGAPVRTGRDRTPRPEAVEEGWVTVPDPDNIGLIDTEPTSTLPASPIGVQYDTLDQAGVRQGVGPISARIRYRTKPSAPEVEFFLDGSQRGRTRSYGLYKRPGANSYVVADLNTGQIMSPKPVTREQALKDIEEYERVFGIPDAPDMSTGPGASPAGVPYSPIDVRGVQAGRGPVLVRRQAANGDFEPYVQPVGTPRGEGIVPPDQSYQRPGPQEPGYMISPLGVEYDTVDVRGVQAGRGPVSARRRYATKDDPLADMVELDEDGTPIIRERTDEELEGEILLPAVDVEQADVGIYVGDRTRASQEAGVADGETNVAPGKTLFVRPGQPETGFEAQYVAYPIMDTQDVFMDVARFQPRARDEARINRIVENFDETKFTPIEVWQDPKDERYYVLSGHHRMEVLQRKNITRVPYVEFRGTEAEAIERAATSNLQSKPQTDMENAMVIRRMIERNPELTFDQIVANLAGSGATRGKIEQWWNLAYLPLELKQLIETRALTPSGGSELGRAIRTGKITAPEAWNLYNGLADRLNRQPTAVDLAAMIRATEALPERYRMSGSLFDGMEDMFSTNAGTGMAQVLTEMNTKIRSLEQYRSNLNGLRRNAQNARKNGASPAVVASLEAQAAAADSTLRVIEEEIAALERQYKAQVDAAAIEMDQSDQLAGDVALGNQAPPPKPTPMLTPPPVPQTPMTPTPQATANPTPALAPTPEPAPIAAPTPVAETPPVTAARLPDQSLPDPTDSELEFNSPATWSGTEAQIMEGLQADYPYIPDTIWQRWRARQGELLFNDQARAEDSLEPINVAIQSGDLTADEADQLYAALERNLSPAQLAPHRITTAVVVDGFIELRQRGIDATTLFRHIDDAGNTQDIAEIGSAVQRLREAAQRSDNAPDRRYAGRYNTRPTKRPRASAKTRMPWEDLDELFEDFKKRLPLKLATSRIRPPETAPAPPPVVVSREPVSPPASVADELDDVADPYMDEVMGNVVDDLGDAGDDIDPLAPLASNSEKLSAIDRVFPDADLTWSRQISLSPAIIDDFRRNPQLAEASGMTQEEWEALTHLDPLGRPTLLEDARVYVQIRRGLERASGGERISVEQLQEAWKLLKQDSYNRFGSIRKDKLDLLIGTDTDASKQLYNKVWEHMQSVRPKPGATVTDTFRAAKKATLDIELIKLLNRVKKSELTNFTARTGAPPKPTFKPRTIAEAIAGEPLDIGPNIPVIRPEEGRPAGALFDDVDNDADWARIRRQQEADAAKQQPAPVEPETRPAPPVSDDQQQVFGVAPIGGWLSGDVGDPTLANMVVQGLAQAGGPQTVRDAVQYGIPMTVGNAYARASTLGMTPSAMTPGADPTAVGRRADLERLRENGTLAQEEVDLLTMEMPTQPGVSVIDHWESLVRGGRSNEDAWQDIRVAFRDWGRMNRRDRAKTLAGETIEYSKVGRIIRKLDKIIMTMLTVARDQMMYNPITGYRASVQDMLGSQVHYALTGNYDAMIASASEAGLKRWWFLARDPYNFQTTLTREYDPTLAAANISLPSEIINPGLSRIGDYSDELELHRLLRNRPVGRMVGNVMQTRHVHAVRQGTDVNMRATLALTVFERSQLESAVRFRNLLQQKGIDDVAVINAAMEAARTRTGNPLASTFSPQDVHTALRGMQDVVPEQATRDMLARAWREEQQWAMNKARKAVDEAFFTLRRHTGNTAMSKLFYFHFWMLNSAVMHTKKMVQNPHLMKAYINMWNGAKEEAERRGYPPTLTGLFQWYADPDTGFAGLWNPIAIVAPAFLATDAMAGEDQNVWEFLDSVLPMTPLAQAALGIMGKSDATPDFMGTRGNIEKVLHTFLTWSAANGMDFTGGGSKPEANLIEEATASVIEAMNGVAKVFGADDANLYRTSEGRSDVYASILMTEAEKEFGAPSSQWTPDQWDEYGLAWQSIKMGTQATELSSRVQQLAADAIVKTTLRNAVTPGGIVMRYTPRDEVRRDANRGVREASIERGLARSSPEAGGLLIEEQIANSGARMAVGEENMYWVRGYEDLKYGMQDQTKYDPDDYVVIGGQKVLVSTIRELSSPERQVLADQWARERGATGILSDYTELRKTAEEALPGGQISTYRDYQSLVYGYSGGAQGFRVFARGNSPAFAQAELAVRKKFEKEGKRGAVLEAELDGWATGKEAYNAYMGRRTTVYDDARGSSPVAQNALATNQLLNPRRDKPPTGDSMQGQLGRLRIANEIDQLGMLAPMLGIQSPEVDPLARQYTGWARANAGGDTSVQAFLQYLTRQGLVLPNLDRLPPYFQRVAALR